MSVNFTLRNARTVVENALVDALAMAYGKRYPTAADAAALRAMASGGMPDRAMRFVTALGFAYQWQRGQTAADDGVNYIQPTDVAGANPGRWSKTTFTGLSSSSAAGYLQKCELYNDDGNDLEKFEERLFGNTPAMLVSFDSIEHEPKSTEPGALYWCRMHFTLFAITVSPRGGQVARQGSPLPTEYANDPGTAAMIGDAKAVLAGVTGEDLGLPDVAYVQIANEQPVVQDQARARYIESLELTVYATLTNPDTANVIKLADPFEFNMQMQLGDVPATGAFDASNEAQSDGLRFALGDGLTQAFAGGAAVINGQPVNIAGAAHTFAANKVTYRDVDATGTLTYLETNVGDEPPGVGFGRARLGVTVTDGTGVRIDRLLLSTLVNFGPVNKVEHGLVTGIALSPLAVAVPHGTQVMFSALATYEDGFEQDVSSTAAWQSSNANVATIDANGMATTIAAGITNITATLDGVTSAVPAVLTAT